jgi:hypothetical protein
MCFDGLMQDWEPLSYHQRHAASIVEVFRIIEEVCVLLRQFDCKQFCGCKKLSSSVSSI